MSAQNNRPRPSVQSLSEAAKALLDAEERLDELLRQSRDGQTRAELLEHQAKELVKRLVKERSREHDRLREIATELKEAKQAPAYQTAEQNLKTVKESSGINELVSERKGLQDEIKEAVAADREVVSLQEQAQEARELNEQAAEQAQELSERNRATSRRIIEQAASMTQLSLF